MLSSLISAVKSWLSVVPLRLSPCFLWCRGDLRGEESHLRKERLPEGDFRMHSFSVVDDMFIVFWEMSCFRFFVRVLKRRGNCVLSRRWFVRAIDELLNGEKALEEGQGQLALAWHWWRRGRQQRLNNCPSIYQKDPKKTPRRRNFSNRRRTCVLHDFFQRYRNVLDVRHTF